MNQILPKTVKNLIKLCIKRPQDINIDVFKSLPKLFNPDEIIHTILLTIHNKMEVELTFATYAL